MASLARASPTLSDIEFGYVRKRTPIVEDDDEEEIVWPIRTSDSSNTTSPSPEDAPNSLNNRYDTYRPSHRRAATVGQHQLLTMNNTKGLDEMHGRLQEMGYFFDDVLDFELVRGDGGTREYIPPNERIRTRARGHRKTQSDSTLAFPRAAAAKPKGRPRPLPQSERYDPLPETWADDVDGIVAPMERMQLRSEQGANKSRSRPKKSAAPEVAADSANGQTRNKSRPQRGPKRQKGGATAKWREKTEESKNTSAKEPGPIPPLKPAIDQQNSSTTTAVKSPTKRKENPRKVKKNKAAVKTIVKADPPRSESAEVPSPTPSTPCGFGARSVVDDISENGDALVLSNLAPASDRDRLLRMAYDESVKFMDAFVEHPDHYTSQASKLTFLQALIVELGLVSTDGPAAGLLPGTLTAAKALLKSHAFLNVRDYLEMRAQGVEALRGAMKTSRRALVRELRGRRRGEDKRGRAPLGWVKETGLTVLLVTL